MKSLYLIPLLLLFQSCLQPNKETTTTKPKTTEPKAQNPSNFDIDKHLKNYNALKENIQVQKKKYTTQELKTYFTNTLIDQLIPYWYGTIWDFNGHTTTPRQGEIACGYFITTTVKDMGIDIPRISLAQKPASDIIKRLCLPTSIKTYTNLEKLQAYLNKADNNEVFILGLDYHVGFVLKRDNQHYFIHSNYTGNGVVEKQILTESPVIHSNFLMIGNLSNNKTLLTNWQKN